MVSLALRRGSLRRPLPLRRSDRLNKSQKNRTEKDAVKGYSCSYNKHVGV